MLLDASGMPYRRWRIPATFINSHAKSRTIHGRLLVSPKLKHYVERLHPPPPDQIAKIVDPAILEKMIDCLQHMRPRQPKRADEAKKRVRRSPMDRGRAKQIVERALAITWKWTAEDQYRDVFRHRYDERRKQALRASKLVFRLGEALHVAASQNLALRKELERPARGASSVPGVLPKSARTNHPAEKAASREHRERDAGCQRSTVARASWFIRHWRAL